MCGSCTSIDLCDGGDDDDNNEDNDDDDDNDDFTEYCSLDGVFELHMYCICNVYVLYM